MSRRWSIVAVVTLILSSSAIARGETYWLDSLDLRSATSGWDTAKRNLSVGGGPIRIAGQQFERGLGTHPPARFAVTMDGQPARFIAWVGVDDEVGTGGTVEFRVLGDGVALWKSGLMRGGELPRQINVDLGGSRLVELVVTSAGRFSTSHRDHADWADARFETEGAPPEVERYPVRYPEVDESQRQWDILQREILAYQIDPAARARWQKIADQVVHPQSLITAADRDPLDVALRRTAALLRHIETMKGCENLNTQRAALGAITSRAAATPVDNFLDRREIFEELLPIRRSIAFANPLLKFSDILFITRQYLPSHYSVGDNICDQYFGFHAIKGGRLLVLEDAFSDSPNVRDVLADSRCENGPFRGEGLPSGAMLSPDLSFDGRTILFAYTQAEPLRYIWAKRSTFAVYRVEVDGSGLRRLTDSPYNEFDPCWLPNDRIAFISERRGGFGRCHGRPVPTYTLHTMLDDGSDIVCISPHETNEWQPSVDNFGRILYTRWDYVDRGDIQAHHPWVILPDGRDPRAVHGNYRADRETSPCAEMDLRAIPDSVRYVGTAAPHHGQAYGSLIVVDPTIEDDDSVSQVRRLTPSVEFPQSAGGGPIYATAWPLDENFYLCVADEMADARYGTRNHYAIYLVDSLGNRELLYRDPTMSCLSPIPLCSRQAPIELPHYSAAGPPREKPGRFQPLARPRDLAPVMLMNVYDGKLPWPQDTKIKELRIVQLLPKTTPSANMPRIGYGSQKNARRILGTVPVEEDGSAYFLMPVDRPVLFQALDERGAAVQSMRSDTHAMAGRGLTCQGCHEPRNHTPGAQWTYPMACRRSPSMIEPEPSGTSPLNFPRLVQPLLDRHCVRCHGADGDKPDLRAGNPLLHRSRWTYSYEALEPYAFYYNDQVFTEPRTIPGRFGARASELLKLLDKGHYDVKLPPEDLRRLIVWLDANSDFFGAYEDIEKQAVGEVVEPSME